MQIDNTELINPTVVLFLEVTALTDEEREYYMPALRNFILKADRSEYEIEIGSAIRKYVLNAADIGSLKELLQNLPDKLQAQLCNSILWRIKGSGISQKCVIEEIEQEMICLVRKYSNLSQVNSFAPVLMNPILVLGLLKSQYLSEAKELLQKLLPEAKWLVDLVERKLNTQARIQ